MKSTLMIIFAILLTACSLPAAPISDVRSSALMPGDSAKFNLDFLDPFGLPLYDVMVKARPAGANADSTVILSHTDIDPRYLNTYEGVMHFSNPSGPIQFYGRVAAETLVTTQSYFNTANQFPPASILYAPLAGDAVGDTMNGAAGDWLDLTGSGVTYSSSRLFVSLSNVSGTWPNNTGLFTYYIYAVYLYNPDTLGLTATAMVYGNIPLLISPGLYHVNLADTSFSRISNINSQVSGGNLHLACNLSDLSSDPNFPTWPPQSGHVIIGGFTMTVTLSTPQFNDYSYPSSFIPETGYLNVANNVPPSIFNFTFYRSEGISITTAYCGYYDFDGNLPTEAKLFFDNEEYNLGSLDHNYADTSYFDVILPAVTDGYHTFYYRFSDGEAAIESPLDTVYIGQDAVEETPLPATMKLEQNYPNPFNAETKISFSLEKPGMANLTIYDIEGRGIANPISGYFESGLHSVIWDGRNDAGQMANSGVYFYKLSTGNQGSITRRMVLLK